MWTTHSSIQRNSLAEMIFFINIVLKDEILISDKDTERWISNLIDKLLGVINHFRNENSLESTQIHAYWKHAALVGLVESPFDSEDDSCWKDKSDWMPIRTLVRLYLMLVIIDNFLLKTIASVGNYLID
jgi:hypothetical protein